MSDTINAQTNTTDLLIIGGGVVGMTLALAANAVNQTVKAANQKANQTANTESKKLTLLAPPIKKGGGRYYALSKKSLQFIRQATNDTPPILSQVQRFYLFANARRYILPASQNQPLCTIVSEDALLDFLVKHLQQQNISTSTWSSIEKYDYDENVIHIKLTNSAESLSARLLVVADGARSATAHTLNVGAVVKPFAQRALTLLVTTSQLPADCAAQWFLSRDILALLPVRQNKSQNTFALIWSLPEKTASELIAQGTSAIIAAVQSRTNLQITAAENSEVQSFPLSSLRRAVPVARRVAFIGDCAQTIHPLAGQGLNIGLRNAEWLLSCHQQHANDTAAALTAFSSPALRRTTLWDNATQLFNNMGDNISTLFYLSGLESQDIDSPFNNDTYSHSPRHKIGNWLRRFATDMQ